MALLDDDRPRKPAPAVPGEILDSLSIDELRGRIALYRGEIERLEREVESKERSRSAAAAFFR